MQLKACPKCRSASRLEAPSCLNCGHQFRTQFVPDDRTRMIGAPEPTEAMGAPPAWGADSRLVNLAIASLVCGICSILLMCVWFLAVPVGVVGILLANQGRRSTSRGLATAGLVTSIVGTAIAGIVAALWIVGTIQDR